MPVHSPVPPCGSCARFPDARPEHDSSEAYKRCLSYSPIGVATKRMMLVEREEHDHLLRLYEAVYHNATTPDTQTAGVFRRRLEACNRFFSGGGPCR